MLGNKEWDCPYLFKDVNCKYQGPEQFCGKTFECCRALGNEHRFGGRPQRPGEGLEVNAVAVKQWLAGVDPAV
jgi:hypothetical protein